MGRNISLSPDIIQLERNGQLLLMDGKQIKPLLVNEGADTIKAYLDICRRCETDEELCKSYNDPLLLDALVDHGIIRYEQQNGDNLTAACEQSNHSYTDSGAFSGGRKHAISLYLLLTQYCNLGCIYCLNGSESYKKANSPRMEDRLAYHAIEKFLQDLEPGGMLEIVFFGGEPLLNWPLAKRIILFCESELRNKYPDRNWKYHFTTNLTVFPNDLIDWVKRYNITFLVNVDGPEHIHNITRRARSPKVNSFRRTTNNIKRLVKADIRPALRTTVTSHNVDYMLQITKLHKELGGSGSAFVPITPVDSDELIMPTEWYPDAKKFVDNVITIMESNIWSVDDFFPANEMSRRVIPGQCMKIACGAPFGNTPTVDVNGDVYACIYLVGIDRYFIGNIFKSEFPKKNVLDKMAQLVNVDNVSLCIQCQYRYMCAGGCPVTRYTIEGNPNASLETMRYAVEKNCIITKELINYLLWKLAEEAVHSLSNRSNPEHANCM